MTTTRRPWFLTLAAVATLSGCSLSLEPVDPAIEELMRDDALASNTPGFLMTVKQTGCSGKQTAAG
ncbi:hypothetical protein [Arthrobacter sp. H5]|uniref:hypothetical protein n=1 Tax=Arthrobacter sp. H5 TaxID=1267973 RepID=UPI0004817C50|nr:hypothetical protein [Arthrobacter sp. H5]